MKCAEIEKQIDTFIDDELNASLAETVERHLKKCRGCQETFTSFQALRRILGKDISVPLPSRLDGRVLEAFSSHHENRQKKKWRAVVFGQISIPKPAFTLALLAFAVFAGLAFQAGKIAATDVRFEMSPMSETLNPLSNSKADLPSESVKKFEDKTSNAPIIKFIEVPVIKEKIVTRVVYLNKQPRKESSIKARSAESKAENFALNSSINENRYLTQINLNKFQPVAELKTKIIKKDKNNEK